MLHVDDTANRHTHFRLALLAASDQRTRNGTSGYIYHNRSSRLHHHQDVYSVLNRKYD